MFYAKILIGVVKAIFVQSTCIVENIFVNNYL